MKQYRVSYNDGNNGVTSLWEDYDDDKFAKDLQGFGSLGIDVKVEFRVNLVLPGKEI